MSGSPPDADQPPVYRQHRPVLPSGACSVLLVRHGESQPYVPGHEFATVDGHADPPLAPEGEQQARLVAARLAGRALAAIYTTTLTRTRQTAAPLVAATGLAPRTEPDLREVHLGEWEGGVFRQRVAERDPLAVRMFTEQRWDVIPGAEPMADLRARVTRALAQIAESHRDEVVAVFTHGGVIGTIAATATASAPFAFIGADNGSITHIVVSARRDEDLDLRLRRFNDTGHLPTDFDEPAEPLV